MICIHYNSWPSLFFSDTLKQGLIYGGQNRWRTHTIEVFQIGRKIGWLRITVADPGFPVGGGLDPLGEDVDL